MTMGCSGDTGAKTGPPPRRQRSPTCGRHLRVDLDGPRLSSAASSGSSWWSSSDPRGGRNPRPWNRSRPTRGRRRDGHPKDAEDREDL